MGRLPRSERGGRRPKIVGRWSDSPSERRIRDYCVPKGIPRSVFLGRVVAAADPLWLPEDLEAALEWQELQAYLCSGCGHDKRDTMNEDHAHEWVVVPLTCHACAARDRENRVAAQEKQAGKFGDAAFDGVFFAVTHQP